MAFQVQVRPPDDPPPQHARPRPSTEAPEVLPVVDPLKLQTWTESMKDLKLHGQLVRLLAKTLIFADTNDQFRNAVVDAVVPVEYPPGRVVFRHGQPGSWMGILLYGRLERKLQRQHSEILIGDVGPGAIMGDLGLFGVSPTRSFTVTALTSSVVLVLSRQKFEEVIHSGGTPFSLGLFRDGTKMANLMADVDSFLKLPCFKGMDKEFVMALRENSEPRLCYQNQVLMKEGHYGDEMYILRAGTVKVIKNEKVVVELPAGVVLGELAVLGADKRRTATVQCSSLCLIRALHSDVFHEILDMYPNAKRVFDHAYVAKLAALDVGNAREERRRMDRISGSVVPKCAEEMKRLFGTQLNIDDKKSRICKGATMALPPVTPRQRLRGVKDTTDSECESPGPRHPYLKGVTKKLSEIISD